jgi:RimJ/RimL family protein N-acetyltransferase
MLTFRPPRLADAPALFAFMGDPAVMRLTHCHTSPRALRRYLAAHACQARRIGFGPWTVLEGPEIIGFGGLYDDPFDPGYGLEVAYFLTPTAQGKGHAGQIVTHALATAWSGGAPLVSAFAHPDNTASRRVLSRAGFQLDRYVPDMERFLYSHPRPS